MEMKHGEGPSNRGRHFLEQLEFDLKQDLSTFLDMVVPKQPGLDINKELSVIINEHLHIVESKVKEQEQELADLRAKNEELEAYKGVEQLLSLPELAASSMMLTIEKELSRTLWEEMQKAADERITQGQYASRGDFFKQFHVKVHMLEKGKFKFQFLDLMIYSKQTNDASKEIKDVLKRTRETFLRKRYHRDSNYVSAAQFQRAFEDFDILKDDRNPQQHIFDEGVGKADVQKKTLKLLRKNLEEFPRLQNMCPLLRLEILRWRRKLGLNVL